MKPISLPGVAHTMSIQEETFQRVNGPVFRLALASALVLAGIYLYLVPTTITVSGTRLTSLWISQWLIQSSSRILVGKSYPQVPVAGR